MGRETPFEETARDVLALGNQYFGTETAHLTHIDPETDHWEASVSTDSEDGPFPAGLELDLRTTYCRRTIEADDQIRLFDAPNQGWAEDPAFETHGLHCYLGTSLFRERDWYGTVCFVSPEPREKPFSDGESMFAELIARLLERELEPITGSIGDVEKLTKYEAAFKKAADGMTITDDEGRILELNAEAASIYGEDRQQLVGRSMREFLPEEFDFEAEWGEIQAAKMKRDEMPILSADGGLHHVEYTAKSDFLPGQHLIVSRDISDRKEHEHRLERQIERLNKFASVLSHDLRNPLNVAQTRLDLASQEFESEHFQAIERSHERMESLIDDMLTLVRDQSTETDIEQIELSVMVDSCWMNVDTGDATLDITTTRTVEADKKRLKQLFENLFRNAVEHGSTTPDSQDAIDDSSPSPDSQDGTERDGGGLSVSVGVLEDGFYIADDGVGIPTENHEKVFEDGYSSNKHGTGFGLTIVKQAVETHGWEIRVCDSAAGGARFEISGVRFGDELGRA